MSWNIKVRTIETPFLMWWCRNEPLLFLFWSFINHSNSVIIFLMSLITDDLFPIITVQLHTHQSFSHFQNLILSVSRRSNIFTAVQSKLKWKVVTIITWIGLRLRLIWTYLYHGFDWDTFGSLYFAMAKIEDIWWNNYCVEWQTSAHPTQITF